MIDCISPGMAYSTALADWRAMRGKVLGAFNKSDNGSLLASDLKDRMNIPWIELGAMLFQLEDAGLLTVSGQDEVVELTLDGKAFVTDSPVV